MIQSPEVQARLAYLSQKALAGDILSEEELKEGILLMRGDRESAIRTSDSSRRKKAIAAIPSSDDLLAELGGL